MTTYFIEQRITAFANQYYIYKTQGDEKKLIAFAHQKRLAMREKFTFYTDDSKKNIAFEVQARSVIDLGARYEVRDDKGVTIGVLGKAFGSSLLRSTWKIFSADEKEPIITVRERNLFVALFRRGWDIIPFADIIPFFIRYHFDFTRKQSQQVVATYEKTTLLRDHYELRISDDTLLKECDWRVLVALGVMMDALQSR